MKPDKFYFPHDYDSTSDPKCQALLSEYGAEGYGIFWHTVELLHKEETHRLPLKQYLFSAIAKQMQANAQQNLAKLSNDQANLNYVERVESVIKFCIMVCELFHVDGDFFYSKRVDENFQERAKLSEIRRLSGKAGAIAKQMQANAQQNLAKSSKGKEIKRKEIKELTPINPLWKNSFADYLAIVVDAKKEILSNPGLVQRRILSFWPNLDVEKSLELSIQRFWGTEAGWKNKKSSKAAEIDMVETLLKTVDKSKVFLSLFNIRSTANSISPGRCRITRYLQHPRRTHSLPWRGRRTPPAMVGKRQSQVGKTVHRNENWKA
jgi:hypothetical protein